MAAKGEIEGGDRRFERITFFVIHKQLSPVLHANHFAYYRQIIPDFCWHLRRWEAVQGQNAALAAHGPGQALAARSGSKFRPSAANEVRKSFGNSSCCVGQLEMPKDFLTLVAADGLDFDPERAAHGFLKSLRELVSERAGRGGRERGRTVC